MTTIHLQQLNYSIIQQDTHSSKIIKVTITNTQEYKIRNTAEYQHAIKDSIRELGKEI